jgi:hypothetical protein
MMKRDGGYYCGTNRDCYASSRLQVVVIPANFDSGGDKAVEEKIHSVVDAP